MANQPNPLATANMATPHTPVRDFIELIRLERTDEDGVFLTCAFPEKQGNTAAIAYGGCTLAMIVAAAYHTVEGRPGIPDFNIYSLNGNYLGPALADRRIRLKVVSVRDTRTFATRFVTAYQTWDNGQERSCFVALVDFQAPVAKPSSRLEPPFAPFSAKPTSSVLRPEELRDWPDVIRDRVKQGRLPQKRADQLFEMFNLGMRLSESKQAPTSIHYDNMIGFDTARPTAQDHLALPDRVAVDWFRCRADLSRNLPANGDANSRVLPVSAKAAQAAFIAFAMDAAVAFVPVTFAGFSLASIGACSSLDCALRYHTEAPDLNDWHLREIKTITGGEEKTYSEARLWDEQLGMVATMTQASILRPRPPPSVKTDTGKKDKEAKL